jgi:hypothetical protein
MVIPLIPPGVTVEGNMLGEIESLRYSNHNLSDANKFPELATQNYLRTVMRLGSLVMTLESKEWVTGLQRAGILNLLEIPHFGRITEINACVKLFLICVHGGFLWMDRVMLRDTQFIVRITRLPTQGEDPLSLFTDNSNEKALLETIKEKHGTHRGARDLDVASITEDTVSFSKKVLAYALLIKCHKYQVPT